jgi:hypothetical protein
MERQGNRLRADTVVWNRKTGKVVASGNVAVTNPQGDVAYGDSINLTDTLKDGVVQNMLVVLEQGGRLAARQGTRQDNGTITLDHAAYTPCNVVDSSGCPKEPSWKITAVRVTYRPDKERIYYKGAEFHLFGLAVPLPAFSNPVGGGVAEVAGSGTGRFWRSCACVAVAAKASGSVQHKTRSRRRTSSYTPHAADAAAAKRALSHRSPPIAIASAAFASGVLNS